MLAFLIYLLKKVNVSTYPPIWKRRRGKVKKPILNILPTYYKHVCYKFESRFSAGKINGNRFLRVLATLIKNNGTLRELYRFSCTYKNVWDIGVYLKSRFSKTVNNCDTFSLSSRNKSQNSQVGS